MSSSGLVVPPASSAVRLGKDTSKVPTLELESSTWPAPSCRVPFQAVRAVRVGMCAPSGPRPPAGWTALRLSPTRTVTRLPRSEGGGLSAHALGEQAELLLEVAELRRVEADRPDHLLRDAEGLVAQGPAVLGEDDGDGALVLHPAVPGDQAGGREALEEGGEGAAVEGQPGPELADRLVVGLP